MNTAGRQQPHDVQRPLIFVDVVKGLRKCWITSKLTGLDGAIDACEVLVDYAA